MAYIYTQFDPVDDVVQEISEVQTAPIWSGNSDPHLEPLVVMIRSVLILVLRSYSVIRMEHLLS